MAMRPILQQTPRETSHMNPSTSNGILERMDTHKDTILFVITKSNYGGAQRYVFDLATSLSHSHTITVALGGNGALAHMLTDHHINVFPLYSLVRDVSLKSEYHSFRELYRLIRTERPTILHLNSSKAGLLGAIAGKLARVPHIVFTAHAWAWNEKRPWHQRISIAFLHWITVLLSDRTITVSHSIYDQMAPYPFTKKRMRVVHLGITPAPRIDRVQARTHFIERIPELKEKKEAFWITTVGELHPVKGHLTMLAAFATFHARHPESVYIVVGDGELAPVLRAYTEAHQISHAVFFTGHIQGVASLLAAFDLFVLPSLSEAFGYVLLEAGAATVPVLASAVGGIPEIITEDTGVRIPPQNEEVLLLALEEIFRSPEKAHVRARMLEKRVHDYFTKERMVEETRAVYQDLMR